MAGFRLGAKKSRSWEIAKKRLVDASNKVEERQALAVRRAALLLERELKKGLRSGAPGGRAFAPLAQTTVLMRRKRSKNPLLDTGSLLSSITTTFDKRSRSAFVGVHRTARGSSGQSLVNVALIHEYGTKPFVIRVTPGVRRLFWRLHVVSKGRIKPLSAKKVLIAHPGIPARPFMRPTLEAVRQKLGDAIKAEFSSGGGPI